MKKSISVSMMTVGCSLLLATSGLAADQMSGEKEQQKQQYSQQEQQKQQQAFQQEQQGQSQYAQNLMTPDKLDGLTVQNQQGEQIGTVDKVVLDSEEGQVAYVVVTSGGFWGVGGDKAVIPWKAVKMQQQGQQQGQQQEGMMGQQGEPVLVLDASKEMLMNAPQGEIQETLDRQQAEQIHQYYGVSPYWEGQGQQQQQQQPGQQQKQQKQDMQKMHQDMMQKDKMQQKGSSE